MSDLSEWEGMSAEEAIRRRRERVRRVCKRLREEEHKDSNSTFWPVNNKPDAFFTVQRYKLGYCENAKVGMTS